MSQLSKLGRDCSIECIVVKMQFSCHREGAENLGEERQDMGGCRRTVEAVVVGTHADETERC
jgi:hypothetical protein